MNHSSRRSVRSRFTSGFTLVELLIVLAVIGILAAILFPVFAKVRETGRRTACASNLRQIGMAFAQYAQDNGDRYPGVTDGPPGANKAGGWIYYTKFGNGAGTAGNAAFDVTQGSLYSYVKNKNVYLCPSDNSGRTTGLSYAINACVSKQERDTTTGVRTVSGYSIGKKVNSIKNPSQFMLLTEETRPGSGAAGETLDSDSTDDGYYNSVRKGVANPDPASYENTLAIRHNEGGNVAFVDGHVRWYKRDQIKDAKFQIGGEGTLDKGCPEFQNIP